MNTRFFVSHNHAPTLSLSPCYTQPLSLSLEHKRTHYLWNTHTLCFTPFLTCNTHTRTNIHTHTRKYTHVLISSMKHTFHIWTRNWRPCLILVSFSSIFFLLHARYIFYFLILSFLVLNRHHCDKQINRQRCDFQWKHATIKPCPRSPLYEEQER